MVGEERWLKKVVIGVYVFDLWAIRVMMVVIN